MVSTVVEQLLGVLACPWGCDRRPADGPPPSGATGRGSGPVAPRLELADGSLRCQRCGRSTRCDGAIWRAMGPRRAPTTVAQLLNRSRLVARCYEPLWRVRSLGLLSGRPFPIDEELAELTDALGGPGLLAHATVIDMACSAGLYGRHLAAAGATVVAVDHSLAFLRQLVARSRADGSAGRVLAAQALAQALPVTDEAVDAVVIGGSLNEIGDRAGALAEAARVLRPGGVLFSMSLLRSPTPAVRLVQAVLAPGGLAFGTLSETVGLLPSSLRLEATAIDGIVVRLTARKLAST